jgi:hypothetical protein
MTRELHKAWLRSSAVFHLVHRQLEEELQRMREKKLSQELIDKKDLQIQNLVEYFNITDELMSAYRLQAANAKFENTMLTEMLTKQVDLNEFLNYQPKSHG